MRTSPEFDQRWTRMERALQTIVAEATQLLGDELALASQPGWRASRCRPRCRVMKVTIDEQWMLEALRDFPSAVQSVFSGAAVRAAVMMDKGQLPKTGGEGAAGIGTVAGKTIHDDLAKVIDLAERRARNPEGP